jgi:hypothetical protein
MKHIQQDTNATTGEVTFRELSDAEVAFLYKDADKNARYMRDHILATTVDPVVSNPLRWADMTAEKQTEWVEYRHALLDIPQQEGFPMNIVWPIQPN